MRYWLNRIRIRRQGAVLRVAAVAVLAAAACGRTDPVPAETPAEALREVPENARVAAPVDLEESPAALEPGETVDSWCVNGSEESMGFRLENGKTVSICVAAGSSDLTYMYGVLGEEPELVYSGPQLGTFEGLSGYTASQWLTVNCAAGWSRTTRLRPCSPTPAACSTPTPASRIRCWCSVKAERRSA